MRNDQAFTLYDVKAVVFAVGPLAPGEVREAQVGYYYTELFDEVVTATSAQGAGQP